MGAKKNKAIRKALNLYDQGFSFHRPYRVLCDGNFLHVSPIDPLDETDPAGSTKGGIKPETDDRAATGKEQIRSWKWRTTEDHRK